jgi:hypothetical protein
MTDTKTFWRDLATALDSGRHLDEAFEFAVDQHRMKKNPFIVRTTRSKFRNRPTVVNGIRFASKREAQRFVTLSLLESKGHIRQLTRQQSFDLSVNGVHICRYIADFVYFRKGSVGDEHRVVEDVKGCETAAFKLKKKLMLACHGIVVKVVK